MKEEQLKKNIQTVKLSIMFVVQVDVHQQQDILLFLKAETSMPTLFQLLENLSPPLLFMLKVLYTMMGSDLVPTLKAQCQDLIT